MITEDDPKRTVSIYHTISITVEGKVHRCTGTEALYRLYGP